jgi:hypothetical protein
MAISDSFSELNGTHFSLLRTGKSDKLWQWKLTSGGHAYATLLSKGSGAMNSRFGANRAIVDTSTFEIRSIGSRFSNVYSRTAEIVDVNDGSTVATVSFGPQMASRRRDHEFNATVKLRGPHSIRFTLKRGAETMYADMDDQDLPILYLRKVGSMLWSYKSLGAEIVAAPHLALTPDLLCLMCFAPGWLYTAYQPATGG